MIERLERLRSRLGPYFSYLLTRAKQDRINISAGYLAYITLLSMVPMLAVLFSILSAFSAFSDAGNAIQEFVVTHFVPAAGDAVSKALSDFVANTGKMTAMGAGFLFVTSIMLISNIDKILNSIWRVNKKRRWIISFSMYWMVLTLGPLLIGLSIAVTSYVTSLKLLDYQMVNGVYQLILARLPFLLSSMAFVGLYLLVPNRKVKTSHAVVGGLVAGLLFEVSKRGFAAYITAFPSYQLIYGALAAIPILFVWVYLGWVIVLLGAEVTAALGEKEQWSSEADMIHSDSSQSSEGESQRDSTDPES